MSNVKAELSFFLFCSLSSNSTAIVLNMENIMSMIIEKNEGLAHDLRALVLTSLKKDNQVIIMLLTFTKEGS